MAKIKDWMLDQESLVYEAHHMNLSEEDTIRHVKKYVTNGVVDESFILSKLKELDLYENS
jgi:hypothetical protein